MVFPNARKSPLLANSAFSGLDLWSHKVFKPSPASLNASHLYTLPASAPVYTRPPSSADSDKSFTSFGDRESFETAREVVETASRNSSPPPASILVTSYSANQIAEVTASPGKMERRRSWQKTKGAIVNWAKPLWLAEEDEDESVRIFGVSLQRNRRLQARQPEISLSPPAMSEYSTSDDESSASTPPPETPLDFSASTVVPLADIPETPGLEAAFTEVKGLGFSGVQLEPPKQVTSQFSPFSFDLPARRPTLHSSPSLDCLGTPSTLEELRNLRQAATDLERQVRQSAPISPKTTIFRTRRKVPPPPAQPLPVAVVSIPARSPVSLGPVIPADSSRKIKRKAVPAFLQSHETISPLSTPHVQSSHTSPRGSGDAIMPTPLTIPEDPPKVVTPRIASLPVLIPPRSTSTHVRKGSSDDSGSFTSASAASSSSDHGPTTPSSSSTRFYAARKPGAFMSMLDLGALRSSPEADGDVKSIFSRPAHKRTGSSGFYAAKGAFMSVLDLSSVSKKTDDEGIKKRGVSRFWRK